MLKFSEKEFLILMAKIPHLFKKNVSTHFPTPWESEQCYQNQDNFIQGLFKDLENAKESVDIEMFIWSLDELGIKVIEKLKETAARGVKVRILVDGVGSPQFNSSTIQQLSTSGIIVKVYRPFSWFFHRFNKQLSAFNLRSALYLILQMNRRNHRKIILIDKKISWVGSANLSSRYRFWRDTMIRLTGDSTSEVSLGFEWVWSLTSGMRRRPLQQHLSRSLVCHNLSIKNKTKIKKFRLSLINQARKEIKIINPYFVPPYRFLIALLKARKRGVNVSLLTTEITDVFFVRWFAQSYYHILLKAGIKIYERKNVVLHSKVMIIDNKAIIGSSNYNHRSINLDLEIDVLVSRPETLDALNEQWELDLKESQLVPVPPNSKWFNYFLKFFDYLKKNS